MNKLLTVLLVLLSTSFIFSGGSKIVGGFNYGMMSGDYIDDLEDQSNELDSYYGVNVDVEKESISSYTVGIEQSSDTGVVGITYTKRGVDIVANVSMYVGGMNMEIEAFEKYEINYITAYFLYPLSFSPGNTGLQIFVGGEVGYFLNAEFTYEENYDNYYYYYNNQDNGYSIDFDQDDWEDVDGNFIDYGVVLAARYSINESIDITASYYLGLPEVADDLELTHNGFKLTAGIGI